MLVYLLYNAYCSGIQDSYTSPNYYETIDFNQHIIERLIKKVLLDINDCLVFNKYSDREN